VDVSDLVDCSSIAVIRTFLPLKVLLLSFGSENSEKIPVRSIKGMMKTALCTNHVTFIVFTNYTPLSDGV